MMGTAGYMSPEMVRGKDSRLIGADIFAFGSILYEMLSRQARFEQLDA